MKLKLLTLTVAVLALLTAGVAFEATRGPAEANVNRAVLGLWRGIDPVDGSQVMRVFARQPGESGQTQLLIGHDTSLTTCTNDNDPSEVGNDKATILGQVEVGTQNDAILTLEGDMTISCFAPNSPGDVQLGVLLELDRRTGALSETLLDPDTRVPTGRPPIVFFQIDTQDRVDMSPDNALVGLWEGIDRNDGSETLRQFLPSALGDDHRIVLANDTLFGLCVDPSDPNDLGNDKAIATGDIQLTHADPTYVAFEGLVTLTCFTPGAPPPTRFDVRYEVYSDDGVLIETVLDAETRRPVRSLPTFNYQVSDRR